MRRFAALYGSFKAAGAEVFGVSIDPSPALKAFAQHCGAPFPMLSDFNHEVSGPYGVAIDDVMGHHGVAGRAAFAIGSGRKVLYAWYSPDGSLPDPEPVLAALGHAG